jgi:hypothetical protein
MAASVSEGVVWFDLAELVGAFYGVIRLGVIGSTTAFGAVRSRFESWGRSATGLRDRPEIMGDARE